MKQEKLCNLEPGTTFKFGGYGWTKLDDDLGGGTLAITTEVVCNKAFDESNSNDWRKSSLRADLNNDESDDHFIGEMINYEIKNDNRPVADYFMKIESDLTADDGMTDYGASEDNIALLTCDLYRKYRDVIPTVDDNWTLTPWTCNDSRSVRRVGTDGAFSSSHSLRCKSYGVRPLCRLKSDILVSVNRENENTMQDMKIMDFDEWLKTGSSDFLETIINKVTAELTSRCKL